MNCDDFKFYIFVVMKNEYTIATRAALRAGEAILEVYGEKDLEIETKADETPLTRADREAHRIIKKALEGTGIPVLSEEGRDIPYEERCEWKQFWLVDPLDGTKEFIKRNGEFTVNIALIEEGRTEFGVVFAPWVGELYVGLPGMGSFRCTQKKHFDQPLDYLVQFADELPLERPRLAEHQLARHRRTRPRAAARSRPGTGEAQHPHVQRHRRTLVCGELPSPDRLSLLHRQHLQLHLGRHLQ